MTTASDPERPMLSHDDAFAVLSDATRLGILRVLAEAGEPLAFSEVFARVAYDDSSNFEYHLDKLVGHFVAKADDGYRLRQSGRRVVEAVRSGSVTDDPVLEPHAVDERCPLCSAEIEVGYRQERVEMYCTECDGLFQNGSAHHLVNDGYLGHMSLPPVGLQARTPAEILETAWTWKHLDVIADSSGVCSRCSAPLDRHVTVCDDHRAGERSCPRCGRRYAVQFVLRCANCTYDMQTIAPGVLLADTAVLAFLTDHGINPITPTSLDDAMAAIADYEEVVRSVDPFEGRFTFSVDDEALTVTVNDDLNVVDAQRHRTDD